MTLEIIVRYFHFIGIFILISSLVAEHLLLTKTMDRAQLKRIVVIDTIYGSAAAIVLITGLMLWFVVGKPAMFYSHNAVFHTKILLFVIMVLLSIYPTIFYYRNQKKSETSPIQLPKVVIMLVRMELLIFCIIPLLATLMSKGVGQFGS